MIDIATDLNMFAEMLSMWGKACAPGSDDCCQRIAGMATTDFGPPAGCKKLTVVIPGRAARIGASRRPGAGSGAFPASITPVFAYELGPGLWIAALAWLGPE